MPPAPALDNATAERIYERLMYRLALASMGDRRVPAHATTPVQAAAVEALRDPFRFLAARG